MSTNSASSYYPEILEDLAAKLAAALIEDGNDPARAKSAASRCVEIILRDWGGLKIYVPRGDQHSKAARNAEIARRWNGRNMVELRREFGLSDNSLRKIVAKAREARRQR